MNKFKTLKDHVYDYIADQILVGNLRPEEKINENVICEELSISRTPVREALIQLASEGILDNVPRKGFVVKSLSEEEATDLYVIIGDLDGLAARLACPNLEEKDFKDMQFYIDSMTLTIESKNYEMYLTQQKNLSSSLYRQMRQQRFDRRTGKDQKQVPKKELSR